MKLKLSLLLVLIITYSWSQSGSTKTFTTNETFHVPAGVTSIFVQAWGGGGSGGGASGSPLLLGRGAAGGGGGAYASAPILVTPGTNLNIVVAGQTSATIANGTAGGNSTITGFETSILAAGGSGGAANNAGGTPLGGIGGTFAASAGTVKFAGGNGGNGNSWNLLGLLLSSGAGGAGAGSGGLGGTAVSGLLLSNAPGNAGSPPGGAGSGAINSALGASQIGGAGAAGRVIISYSCANFSITSTTATGICASAGTTSSITITGSAASLPVGSYVVMYDRSSPVATSLTANLTVSTAGTGTFIATGLTTAGSSTITVTKLTSESCSSTITANNTASVIVSAATVGGTVSGGTTINSGDTSGLLTLSGHTGSVIKWQSSVSPFTTWTDIANTTTTYTSGPLTETTQFRAVVQNGIFCAALNSESTTVTVNPRPTITLAAAATTVCSSSTIQTTGLSYSSLTGSPTTYSIVWDVSPANSFAAVIDGAIPASPFTIVIPAGTVAGTYTGTLTVKNANGAVSTPGSIFTVTINPSPTITLTQSEFNVCAYNNNIAQTVEIPYSGTTGSPDTYSIVWESSPANNLPEITDRELSESPISFFVSHLAEGVYTGTLTVKNANGCVSSGSVITINAVPIPRLTTTGIIDPVCSSNTVQNATLSYSATVNNPTLYSIDWDDEAFEDQDTSLFSFVSSGGVINNIQVPANVPAGSYSGTIFISDGNCNKDYPISIVINPSPTITLTQTEFNACSYNSFSQPIELAYSNTTGSPLTYSIVWDASSPNNSFANVTNEALPDSPIEIEIPEGTIAGTYTGILTVKNAAGCVSSNSSFYINIQENPTITSTGQIDSVNQSTSAQNASLSYSGVTGDPTSYSLYWGLEALGASFENQEDVPFTFVSSGGVINNIEIPANVAPGSYTGTMYIINGTCFGVLPVSITINALPTIELASSVADICPDVHFFVNSTTLSYSATTGNPVTYSIVWNASPANNLSQITDAQLPDSPITIIVPVSTNANTYTGTLTVKDASGNTSLGSVFTLKVNQLVNISAPGFVVSIDPVNTSSSPQTTTLTYDSTTGNPTSYSIDWNDQANIRSLADQSITSFAFVPNGGILNNIEISADALPGTYQGRLRIYGEICETSIPVSIVINNPAPTITLASSTADLCTNDLSSQRTTLSYSATTGNPVTFSIFWDEDPVNSFFTIIDSALPASSISILIPTATHAGTYTGTLTVKDANGVESVGSVFTLTVNATPKITTNGTIDSVFTSTSSQNASLIYSQISENPTSYYIDWDVPANAALLTDQASTPFTFISSGGVINNIEIPANVPPGSYSGKIYISNGNCTLVRIIDIDINEPAPTIQTAPSANLVCSNINAQTTKLEVGAITGSPTTYSIVWNTSPANNFVDVTDATLVYNSSFIIDVPTGTAVATYTGILTVKNENGIESSGNSFTVTVNETPTITTTGIIKSVCSSNNPQGAFLQYTTSSGSPSSYSIDWDVAANDALLEDQPTTSFTFATSTSSIIIDIASNVLPGTYSGTLVINNAVCSQSYPISITITTGSVGGTVTGGTTITSGSTSGLLTLSGNTGGVSRWQSSVSPFTTWTDIANTNTTYTSGPLTETTKFRAVVQGGACFRVNSEPTTVTVLPSSGKSISEIASAGTDLESAEKATSVTAFNQVINVETTNETINQVFVFDVAGNLLYRKDGVSDSKLIINSLRSSNQVLVVKVVLNDNRIATKKVIY